MTEAKLGWLSELLADHQPPCVSIYQPVQRAAPPPDEDPVRLRNLVRKMTDSLHKQYPDRQVRQMLEKIEAFANDEAFWRESDRDAVAFFASPDYFQAIDLQRPVREQAVIADSFHVKPLIRVLQSGDRFHVLALTQHDVRLYEGNRYRLREVKLRNVPRNIHEISGMRLSEGVETSTDLKLSPLQQADQATVGAAAPLDRFFRAVDKAVWENHSRPSKLPLILAAIDKYHVMFQAHSENPHLMKEGIRLDPAGVSVDRLREEAWKIMEPKYIERLNLIKDQFHAAKVRQFGSEVIPEVAQAAAQGRVGTLLIDADQKVPGKFHPQSGMIEEAALTRVPSADDLLDDLAETVLKMDGQVLVVPHEQMPTETGLAAIYRY